MSENIKGKIKLVIGFLFIPLFIGNYYYDWISAIFYIYLPSVLIYHSEKDKEWIVFNVTFWFSAVIFIILDENGFKFVKEITFLPMWFIIYISYEIINITINTQKEKIDKGNSHAN